MIEWLDLRVEGDSHPRRFDGPVSLRLYLERVERLPGEAVKLLLERGEVGPPHARRGYRVEPLRR
ncbi:hypothetical protein DAETH_19280 [Deinococcus aetherius]|uniref:Uncharacterized protein n=1 Tax=Deinococcus aetherius TaxID=200252 RepID=A0ABM8ADV1_9DEIO|nr:hypothetical protein [Deinococcus aetherius]BDP41959.1 hypothetical protein DAETH_19280 [Deinococcus aetherius]